MKPNGVVNRLLDNLKLVVGWFALFAQRNCRSPKRVAQIAPSVVVVTSGDGAITILDADVEGVPFQAANVLMPSVRARLS